MLHIGHDPVSPVHVKSQGRVLMETQLKASTVRNFATEKVFRYKIRDKIAGGGVGGRDGDYVLLLISRKLGCDPRIEEIDMIVLETARQMH